ncbi:tetratricopeptide repeat protein [Streptomyces sp. NPDC026294]|uniref:tetratricopeptide repeat protein n=1 Tax=Streptomyces sp. NPDC026294 TaxID=3155362 RepID=UPI0033DF91D6
MSSQWEQAAWLVSIARAEGRPPSGAGVLVTDRHVLTCAHVAAAAGDRAEPPDTPVSVRFQWAGGHEPVPAAVVAGGWHPQDAKGRRGDLAVLELLGPLPPSAAPAPLISTRGGTFDHAFHVYGYPRDHEYGGVPANGIVRGAAEHEWIELESQSARGHALAPGFSGSPVWDRTLGGVIGIVTTRDRPSQGQDTRTSYAIPVDTLATYWPPLRDLIRDPVSEDQRAVLEELLALPLDSAGELPRLHDVRIYDMGVTPSKNLQDHPDPPYVPRLREDRALDEALLTRPFVLLAGDAKAGKSRTLVESLRRVLPHGTRLIVPGPAPSAPGGIAALPLPTGGDGAVLWLDDIDEYLRPGGLDTKVLDAYRSMRPPVRVVATITSEWLGRILTPKGEVNRAARQVLERAPQPVLLPRLLRQEDLADARRLYPDEDFTDRGIGELMVAAPLVEARFNGGRAGCPEGWAVVLAAADWHRMGCEGELTSAALAGLFTHYLEAGPSHRAATDVALRSGIAWATEPVAGSIALLTEYSRTGTPGAGGRADGSEGRRYEAFAYLPGYLDSRDDPDTARVPRFAWDWAVRGTPADQLLGVAFAAFTREEGEAARSALERALAEATDRDVVAWAALMLGELAMYRGDVTSAKRLLERATDSDAPDVVSFAQVDLAAVLQLSGDLDAARAVLETVIATGDPLAVPLAQASLGGLLLGQGETDRARELLEAALRSGDSQVVPLVQMGFGGLIVQRGEMSGATTTVKREPSGPASSDPPARFGTAGPLNLPRAVRQSAISSAVPLAQVNLSAALLGEGELEQADELLHSALRSGNPMVVPLAQANLGGLHIQRGELEEARQLLDAAAASGHVFASEHAQVTLAWLFCLKERYDEASEILRRAVGFTNPEQVLRARCLLSTVHAARGDYAAAAEELQPVVDSAPSDWPPLARTDQGLYWCQAGQYERARTALTEMAGAGHPEQSPRAADLLGDLEAAQEQWQQAEAAYRQAIGSGHPLWSLMARFDLAVMCNRLGDERDRDLLAEVAASQEPDLAPRASDLLGDVLAARGDWAEAEAAYQRAIDAAHPHWSAVARLDLAMMLADRGELARSEALFREESTSGSALAEVAEAFLGILLVQQEGRAQEGRPLLERLVTSGSDSAADLCRVQLGKLAVEEGRMPEATAHFEALLDSTSEVAVSVIPIARAHLGAILLRQGHVDEALERLDETDFAHPGAAAVALLGYGEFLIEVGDTTAAQEYLNTALGLEVPDTVPKALALLGVALLAEGDLDGARAALTEALATGTSAIEPLARRYLGSALARLGRLAEARDTLLPLARSDDSVHRPQGLVILGQLAVLDKHADQAHDWLAQAAASDDPEARCRARQALDEFDATPVLPLGPGPPGIAGPEPTGAPPASALPEPIGAHPASAPVQPASPPGQAPSPDDPPEPSSHAESLPADLLLVFGRIAEGEGLPHEAHYWFERALATGERTWEAQALLASLTREDGPGA